MNAICLAVWYIFFTSCAIIALVIRLVRSFSLAIKELVFYILIASIIYGGYMIISFFCKKKGEKNKEVKISNEDSSLLRDHLFKYLFTLAVGGIFLSDIIKYLLNYFDRIFSDNEKWYDILEICCSQFVVPIIILVDVFLIPRRRVPKPMLDLIILLIIIVVYHFFRLLNLDWKIASIEAMIASLLKSLLFSFDGYVLYDFILHKVYGPGGKYHLFGISSSSSQKSSKSMADIDEKEEKKLKSDDNMSRDSKKV